MTIGVRLTRAFLCVSLVILAGAVITMTQFFEVVSQTRNLMALDDRLTRVYRLERDIRIFDRQLSEVNTGRGTSEWRAVTAEIRKKWSTDLGQVLQAFQRSGQSRPDVLVAANDSVLDELAAVERLAEAGDRQALDLRLTNQFAQVADEITTAVDRLTSDEYRVRLAAGAQVERTRITGEVVFGLTALASLLVSVYLGLRVTRSITRPLLRLKEGAHQLARNDFRLDLQAGTGDELDDVGRGMMIAARQLESSYSALKRSNDDLEQFAYAVSHDLREPLRTIASFSQLLNMRYRGELGVEGAEYLDLVIGAAAHMNELISGILEYSRLTNVGAQKFEDLDTSEILDHVLSNLRGTIEETGALVTYGSMPRATGNRLQMIQVFQNLISNGIKYRRRDVSPQIHVWGMQEHDRQIFCVEDNGIGIDPKHHFRIFGMFQQLQGRRAGGVGIGLAITKRIIEQHAGEIWVESAAGSGARFLFSVRDVSKN